MNDTLKKDFLNLFMVNDDLCLIVENMPPAADQQISTEQIQENRLKFFEKVTILAAEHNLKVQTWGPRNSFTKSISKTHVRQKIKEAVEARDTQLKQLYPDAIKEIKFESLNFPEVEA